jgi:hypothetical protein
MLDRIIATHCWKQGAVINYSLYVSAKVRNLLFYLKVLIARADPSIIWVYFNLKFQLDQAVASFPFFFIGSFLKFNKVLVAFFPYSVSIIIFLITAHIASVVWLNVIMNGFPFMHLILWGSVSCPFPLTRTAC